MFYKRTNQSKKRERKRKEKSVAGDSLHILGARTSLNH